MSAGLVSLEAFLWCVGGRLLPLSSHRLSFECVYFLTAAYKDTHHIALGLTLVTSF